MAALFRSIEVPSITSTKREVTVEGYGLTVLAVVATTGSVRLWVDDPDGPPHFTWSPSGGLLPSVTPIGIAWDGSPGFHGRERFTRLWVQGSLTTPPTTLHLRIHLDPDVVPVGSLLVVGTKP